MMYSRSTTLLLVNVYPQYSHQSSRFRTLQRQLVLHLEFDNSGHLNTKITDKRDNFDIINFLT